MILVKLVLQNGLALHLTASALKSLLNFNVYLIYHLNYEIPTGGTICLAILADFMLIFFIVDIFVVNNNKLDMIFSPWLALILMFASIIANNWLRTNFIKNKVISLILLIVSSLLAIIKLIVVVYNLLIINGNKRDETLATSHIVATNKRSSSTERGTTKYHAKSS